MTIGLPLVAKSSVFPDLLAVQQKLQSSNKVYGVTVFVGKNWTYLNGVKGETSYFQSSVVWKERPENYEVAADEIAAIVLASYPEVARKDVLGISSRYGYDIGIANYWITQNFQHSPQQWADKLARAK
jgi:hypothetical protein